VSLDFGEFGGGIHEEEENDVHGRLGFTFVQCNANGSCEEAFGIWHLDVLCFLH
jgi:hypothetical protein